ncbi:hypothetical protein [Acetivibrio saccincola]|uniref:hypothetical protein n=1 Tax=Acetivibrio saccincola TaxID=1677857 RepID=UPI0016B87332|nr:hypothetical protein [Acetivibrio saccincola]NLW27370.1 hypothetical protein [Acetivibrio saccincola]
MRKIEKRFLEKDKILIFPNGQTIPRHLKYWRILWFNLYTGEDFSDWIKRG